MDSCPPFCGLGARNARKKFSGPSCLLPPAHIVWFRSIREVKQNYVEQRERRRLPVDHSDHHSAVLLLRRRLRQRRRKQLRVLLLQQQLRLQLRMLLLQQLRLQ